MVFLKKRFIIRCIILDGGLIVFFLLYYILDINDVIRLLLDCFGLFYVICL